MSKNPKYLWLPGRDPPPIEPHSEAKHQIFSAYLNAYLKRLTLRPVQERLRLTIVDGFCGGGIYRGFDGRICPGSPMIFLNEYAEAQRALQAQRNKPFKLDVDFIFVDESQDHCEYLREEIRKSPHGDLLRDRIQIRASRFADVCPEIITQLSQRRGKRRALFFLDQYGYSDVPLALIRSVLNGVEGAEVMLTFAIDSLINYLSDGERFRKAVKSVELTGEDIARLRKLWEQSADGARYVVQNALFEHVARSTNAPYNSPFFVRSNTSKRAYWLVHLSKHHTARDVMGEIHWHYQNASSHYGQEGLLSLGFDGAFEVPQLPYAFDADARARSMRRVESEAPRLIHDFAKRNGDSISFEDFYARICSQTPVTRRMLSDVLVKLRAANEIKVVGGEGAVRKRTLEFDWVDKISRPDEPTLFGLWNPARYTQGR